MKKTLTFLIVANLLASCNNGHYSLNDFDGDLRKDLEKIVNKGVLVTCSQEVKLIEAKISLSDIKKIAQSEHPILRALGGYLYVNRKDFLLDNFYYELLKDTAIVTHELCVCGSYIRHYAVGEVAATEFGKRGYFKGDSAGEKKYFNKLILEYPFLEASINILNRTSINLTEVHYKSVKQMALSKKLFIDKEDALLALASYRKAEDIQSIKKNLLDNVKYLGYSSFKILSEFQDERYMPVINKYAFNNIFNNNYFSINSFSEATIFKCLVSYNNKKFFDQFVEFYNFLEQKKDNALAYEIKYFLIKEAKNSSVEFYRIFATSFNLKKMLTELQLIRMIGDYKNAIYHQKMKKKGFIFPELREAFDDPPTLPSDYKGDAKLMKLQKEYMKLVEENSN
jgi:hypothetical protein